MKEPNVQLRSDRPLFTASRGAKLVVAVIAALLFALAFLLIVRPAGALICRTCDDPGGGGGDGGGGTTTYNPPANGFEWSMPSRFGRDDDRDGVTDYHWNQETATYAQSYVNPTGFDVNFNGCPTQDEYDKSANLTTVNSYTWTFGDGTTQTARNCRPTHRYKQGSFTVKLDYFASSQKTFTQNVTVRDLLIVSLGDSYGSGEGNPDLRIPTEYRGDWFEVWYREGTWPIKDTLTGKYKDAKWVDKRCHRSALAGSAQAAKALEYSDPHSSVTFISLACSGATINRDTFKDNSATKPQGSGVLGKYRGIDPPNGNDPSSHNPANWLPSQVDALARTLAGCAPTDETCVNRQGRSIDSLIISGGGNDAYFADIVSACVSEQWCNSNQNVRETMVDPGISALPGRYDALATAIHNPSPDKRPALNLSNLSRTYLTQYPDPTRNESGATCDSILGDIVWGKHINSVEANWARTQVIEPLNQSMAGAASRNAHRGWTYVDGISSQFANNGYCAKNHWVVHPMESRRNQGPYYALPFEQWEHTDVLMQQTGMMHPNVMGHNAYSNSILPLLRSQFNQDPNNPLPSFGASLSTPDGTSTQGSNGWLTGSNVPGKALLTVAVDDSSGVASGDVAINGTGACLSTGAIECSVVNVSPQRKEWRFRFSQDGIHRLEFVARGGDGQATTYTHEARVDLQNPEASAAEVSRPPDANGLYTKPVDVTLNGVDQAGGSGVYKIEYTINGGSVVELPPGGKVTVNNDGANHIRYNSVDSAGRKSPTRDYQVPMDITGPDTAVTSGPTGTVKSTSASFAFSSTEAGSKFECSLNYAAFSPCASPKGYTGLASKTHTFRVRAVDAAGNRDDTPATRTWTADTVLPTVSGMSPRNASVTRDITPTIRATVKDNLTNLSKANIKLYVNGKLISPTKYSYSRSTDVLTYNSPKVAKGKKTVRIVATDTAKNVRTASWYFTIR
jgi:hypothetical protein